MWDVLAIAPTDDPKAIRRAYAARLKQIDPDRDRETFARLRQALEWALASADRPARRPTPESEPARDPVPADDAEPVAIDVVETHPADADVDVLQPALLVAPRQIAPRPPMPPVAKAAEERAGERMLLIGLDSALQRGDAHDASQLYVRAAAIGAVPLGDAERMLARLFAIALEDQSFDGTAFRDLAKTFGWDRPELDSAVVSDVRRRVAARLAAEDWYDGLLRTAESRWLWFPRYRSRISRLLLRRIRGWGLVRIDRRALRATLDFMKPHAVWLRDRIPPEWVATLERRIWRRELVANAAATLLLTFVVLDAAFVAIGGLLGRIEDASAFGLLILIAVTALLMWLLHVFVKHVIELWRSPPR